MDTEQCPSCQFCLDLDTPSVPKCEDGTELIVKCTRCGTEFKLQRVAMKVGPSFRPLDERKSNHDRAEPPRPDSGKEKEKLRRIGEYRRRLGYSEPDPEEKEKEKKRLRIRR